MIHLFAWATGRRLSPGSSNQVVYSVGLLNILVLISIVFNDDGVEFFGLGIACIKFCIDSTKSRSLQLSLFINAVHSW
jgi:hypothetical protein